MNKRIESLFFRFIVILFLLGILLSRIIGHTEETSSPVIISSTMEDYLVSQKLAVTALTPKNYSTWIQEIKEIATRAQVWEYVDPEGDESELDMLKYSKFKNYIKIVSIATSGSTQETTIESFSLVFVFTACEDYDDLSKAQQRSYDAKERFYKALQQEVRMTSLEIQKVHTIVLESARGYIAVNRMASFVREILISLFNKFKRPDADLQLQIDERYEELKASNPSSAAISPSYRPSIWLSIH